LVGLLVETYRDSVPFLLVDLRVFWQRKRLKKTFRIARWLSNRRRLLGRVIPWEDKETLRLIERDLGTAVTVQNIKDARRLLPRR
jgi:hypothetical protein